MMSDFHILSLIFLFKMVDEHPASLCLPVVPRKAVAEVSKIGNLKERSVVVNHGWQSESTDGPKGG